jgi:hypothetical protein
MTNDTSRATARTCGHAGASTHSQPWRLDPHLYIQKLLTYLSNSTDFTNPNGSGSFDSFPD